MCVCVWGVERSALFTQIIYDNVSDRRKSATRWARINSAERNHSADRDNSAERKHSAEHDYSAECDYSSECDKPAEFDD